jgi:hypothetical protein
MPQIPAQCSNEKCRHIFPSGINLAGGATVKAYSNVSRCPLCHSPAVVAEGLFGAAGEFIRLISGPDVSKEMLRTAGLLLIESYQKGDNAGQIAEKLDPVLPALAHTLREIAGDRVVVGKIILALIALITAWIAMEAKWNINFGDQIINETLYEAKPSTVLRDGKRALSKPLSANVDNAKQNQGRRKPPPPRAAPRSI